MEIDTDEQRSKEKSNKKYFRIKSVNSYGTSDLDSLNDDQNEIHLTSRAFNFLEPLKILSVIGIRDQSFLLLNMGCKI